MTNTVLWTIITVNTHLTTILSIVPNTLVIYLTFTVGINEVRRYRWIVAIRSTLEIATCAILSAINMAMYQNPGHVYLLVMGAVDPTGQGTSRALLLIYTFLFVANILFLQIVFLFRYAYICNSYVCQRMFTLKGAIACFVLTFLLSASMSALFVTQFRIDSGNVYQQFGHLFGQSHFNVFSLREGTNGFVRSATVNILMVAIIAVAYSTIFTVAIRIIVQQSRNVNASDKTRKLRKQLTIVMLLQGLLPLFLIVVPLVCVYALTLTPFQAGAWASLAPVSFNWEPCAHPFITIYFVSPFRRRFRQCFRLDACRPRHITVQNEAATAAATHHQQPRHTVHIQLPTAAAGNSHYPTTTYQEHRQLPGHYPIEPLTIAPPIKRQISCTQFHTVNVAPPGHKPSSIDASASNAIQPSLRNAALTNTIMWC